jgi:hypothetical protein
MIGLFENLLIMTGLDLLGTNLTKMMVAGSRFVNLKMYLVGTDNGR